MSISGCTFTYNQISSSSYNNLAFAQLETTENKELGGKLEYSTYKTNLQPKQNITNVKYSDPLSFDVEMIAENMLSISQIEALARSLFNQMTYKPLIVDNSDYSGLHFNCYFTNVEKIERFGKNGFGVYGFKSTMVCDSQFMWTSEITSTFNSAALINNITIVNDSAVAGYTYPSLILKTGTSGGNITIQCITDTETVINSSGNLVEQSKIITIDNTIANDTISILTNPYRIKSLLGENYINDFNIKFPRLLYGNNVFNVSGDVTEVSFKFEKARVMF